MLVYYLLWVKLGRSGRSTVTLHTYCFVRTFNNDPTCVGTLGVSGKNSLQEKKYHTKTARLDYNFVIATPIP